jgi:hypothetical protein
MPCCTTVLDVLNKLQCTSKILIITNPHVPWHVSRPLFERVIFRFHGSFIAAGFLFSTPLALLNNICSSFLFANSVFRWISAVCHRLPLFTGRCCCYGYFVMPVGSENKGPSRSVVEDQYRSEISGDSDRARCQSPRILTPAYVTACLLIFCAAPIVNLEEILCFRDLVHLVEVLASPATVKTKVGLRLLKSYRCC